MSHTKQKKRKRHKKRTGYRFRFLTRDSCKGVVAKGVIALYQNCFPPQTEQAATIGRLRKACRRNSALIVASPGASRRFIEAIALVSLAWLPDGLRATIDIPAVAAGSTTLSGPLLAKAIAWAKKKGATTIEVTHRTLGVIWPHRNALHDLGFSRIGAHVYSLAILKPSKKGTQPE